jgi:hypothetical protein
LMALIEEIGRLLPFPSFRAFITIYLKNDRTHK